MSLHDIQHKYNNNNLSANINKSSRNYNHEGTVVTYAYNNGEELDYKNCKELQDIFQIFMKWIYKQLEEYYNFWYDENTIREEIEVNEYKFLKNGEIYN